MQGVSKRRVVVITGKDKGKKGEVLKVLPKENRVLVAGLSCRY
jgi:large subunit ribosomal protein L24